MLSTVIKRSTSDYDYNYIYTLLMNPDFGVMEGLLPDAMMQCPSLMKAKGKDPDLPPLHEALAGPNREDFLEAMRNEIKELEEHGTWTVVKKSSVPD